MFLSDMPDAATLRLQGMIAALQTIREGWPHGLVRFAIRQQQGYLVLPSTADPFRLPDLGQGIDYNLDVKPFAGAPAPDHCPGPDRQPCLTAVFQTVVAGLAACERPAGPLRREGKGGGGDNPGQVPTSAGPCGAKGGCYSDAQATKGARGR